MLGDLFGIDTKDVKTAVKAAEDLSATIAKIRIELEKHTTLLQQIKDKLTP